MQQTQAPETLLHPGFATCRLCALEEMTLQPPEPCLTRLQDGGDDLAPARLLEGQMSNGYKGTWSCTWCVVQMMAQLETAAVNVPSTGGVQSPGPPGTLVSLSSGTSYVPRAVLCFSLTQLLCYPHFPKKMRLRLRDV